MEQVINILFQEALYRTFTFAGSEGNTDTNVQQQYAWKNYAYEQQSQNAFSSHFEYFEQKSSHILPEIYCDSFC